MAFFTGSSSFRTPRLLECRTYNGLGGVVQAGETHGSVHCGLATESLTQLAQVTVSSVVSPPGAKTNDLLCGKIRRVLACSRLIPAVTHLEPRPSMYAKDLPTSPPMYPGFDPQPY